MEFTKHLTTNTDSEASYNLDISSLNANEIVMVDVHVWGKTNGAARAQASCFYVSSTNQSLRILANTS